MKALKGTVDRYCFIAVCDVIWGHDDVIKWKHFPRYWPFVRGIHRSAVNSPHKGQWRGALMFSLICVWINGGVNNDEACDLRRYRAHYDITVMSWVWQMWSSTTNGTSWATKPCWTAAMTTDTESGNHWVKWIYLHRQRFRQHQLYKLQEPF